MLLPGSAGLGIHRAAASCLAVPCADCFYTGTLKRNVNPVNWGSFKSVAQSQEGGQAEWRAGLLNFIATVHTLWPCQVFGCNRSVTWAAPGSCSSVLFACAELGWNETQRPLLLSSEAARGTHPTLVGLNFAWKANRLLQHRWKFVKTRLHNLC